MKTSIKRFITSLLAMALVFSSILVLPAMAEEEALAYLGFGNGDWSIQYWGDGSDNPVTGTTATITEYGTYTVGIDASAVELTDIGFMMLGIKNGEAAFPESFITIDSMKVNGEEVTLGKAYTSSDDGIETRVNLFNAWATEINDGRTIDGDPTDCTATPFDPTAFDKYDTIEVTFTLGKGIETFAPYAYIGFGNGDWSIAYWHDGNEYPVTATTATVRELGTYTVGIDATGAGWSDIGFMMLGLQRGEAKFPNGLLTIDSMTINGEAVALGRSYTCSDDGVETRVNLYNAWVGDTIPSGRTADGDGTDCTPILFDPAAYTDIQTLEVTFTLSNDGIEAFSTAEEVVDENADPYSGVGAYMAFFQVQTSTWVYRDGFENSSTGYGSEFFNTVFDNETSAATSTVVVDTMIDGDGVYQVALKDTDFAGSTDFNMVGISTNIPVGAGIEITNAKLTTNGAEISSNGIQKDDNDTYLQVMMINQYDDEIKDTVNTMVPADGSEMIIEFTVSGFGYEKTVADTAVETTDETTDDTTADTADTVEAEPEAEEDGDGLPTGVIIAIVVGAVVAIGGGAFALKKKK